jgi:solute carrier family 25 carnitine/acylcarnitine transporter 20/29
MDGAYKDFVAGLCGGVAGLVVGHPFDTIKARLQTQGVGGSPIRYHGAIHCFTDIVKTEGVHGLYKGLTSPLLGMGAINATVFGVYGICIRHLDKHQNLPFLFNSAISGAAAGFVQSFICSPVELIKLRMQVHGIGKDEPSLLRSKLWNKRETKSSHHRSSLLSTGREIVLKEGLQGLNKGIISTLYRETPAFALYFFSFDFLCLMLANGSPVSELGPMSLCIAGGISGINGWVISYPFDVVKSRIQVDGVVGPPQYNGMIDCFKKSYRSEGWKVFFKGLTPTLVRAFPVNGATFCTVTYVLRLWRKEE